MTRTGTTAAAVLPAALAGALLVSAPFAGTTTAPLAKSTTSANVSTAGHATASRTSSDALRMEISPGSVAMLVGAEMLLLGVGGGVLVMARRSRAAEES